MATTNFIGGAKKLLYELFCTEDLTGGIHNQVKCSLVINIFLSITATLGNDLIQDALRYESSLHPPSKVFLRCLASTDLLRWSNWWASCCHPLDICDKVKLEYLPLRKNRKFCYRLPTVRRVVETERNKCGQTACVAVISQVQTSCNLEENIRGPNYRMSYNATMSLWNNLAFAASWYGYKGITQVSVTQRFSGVSVSKSASTKTSQAKQFH